MGPSSSSADRAEPPEVSDECFQKILDAETLRQTSSQRSQGTEQTLFLSVQRWWADDPSIHLLLDERSFNKPFDGWLNAKKRTLEFRFKVSPDYPGDRAKVPAHIKSFLSNGDLLGITTTYIGPDAVRNCMDVLKKARSRRPRWSDPISMYDAQFFWMKRSPQSPSIYVKMVVDSWEVCILVVNENIPEYKNEFGSDVHKFIQVVALPLRIELRVTWWKSQLKRYAVANPDPSSPQEQVVIADRQEDQWWWPLLQAKGSHEEKAKVKTTEEAETQLCAYPEHDDLATAGGENVFTPQQQNPPSSSHHPQTSSSHPQKPSASSKKMVRKKGKNKKKGLPASSDQSPSQTPLSSESSSSAAVVVAPQQHNPSYVSMAAPNQPPSPHPASSKAIEGKPSQSPTRPPHSSKDWQSKQITSVGLPVQQPSTGLASPGKNMSGDKQHAESPTSKVPSTYVAAANKGIISEKAGTPQEPQSTHPGEQVPNPSSSWNPISRRRHFPDQYIGVEDRKASKGDHIRPATTGPKRLEYAKVLKGEHKTSPDAGPSHQGQTNVLKGEHEESLGTESSRQAGGEAYPQEKQEPSTGVHARTCGPGDEETVLDSEHKARSEAITLIRARTVSRASPTRSSPTEAAAQCMGQSPQQGSTRSQKKKSRKKKKAKMRESHPAESSGPRGCEAPLEHTSAQTPSTEPSVKHDISTSEPSSSQSQGPGSTPVIEPAVPQLHPDLLKSKQPPIPKFHQSGSGSRGERQAADHSSGKHGQSSDPRAAHPLAAEQGKSSSGAGTKDTSKVPLENRPSAQQGPSSQSAVDTKDESKPHSKQPPSTTSDKSSSGSDVEGKDKPNIHLEHLPSTKSGESSSSSRVNTEDVPGKYDHLLGDPSLDLSGNKNKGRADTLSKGPNPSSKSFSPLSVRSKGSPIAIRCGPASDPQSPAKVSTKSRRYGLTPERLPPIQEASPPGAAGGLATPGSSTTAQTGWTGLGHQVTPDSNLTAGLSESASGPTHASSGAVAGPDSSHAHPGVDHDAGVECALSGCTARCNLWDWEAVFCPRCGPLIGVRYCTQAHLHEDVKWHWVYCGQGAPTHACPADVIPRQVREGVPLMPCLHAWDTPEKHRQAVRFHAGGLAGDYFVFADWADLREAGFPANPVSLRCSSRVIETIRFDDPEEKDRFRRVLAVCLFSSIENVHLVDFLFRLIRDVLRSRDGWTAEMDAGLRWQFQAEFSVTIRTEITGERHACGVEWEGINPRHCRDPVCSGERRYFLGDPGRGRGYRQLVSFFEASYWILRAARTTHPQVPEVAARTRGEGFPGVVEEEKRLFRRGPGWDGAGTGDMEIEGINA